MTSRMKTLCFAFCLLLLCGCGGTRDTTTERQGTTAVLLEPATVSQCDTYQTSDAAPSQWEPLSQTVSLNKGDLVLILTEENGTARVYLPGGDTPGVYGSLPSHILSQNQADLVQGNLAKATDCMAYQSIDGQEAEVLTGSVQILHREGDWCQVRPLAGGDTRTFWIPAQDLSFDFDTIVPDRK